MNKLSEQTRTRLYATHAVIIWAGAIWQIAHIFTYKSAQDITVFWVSALLVSELVALPLACSSRFGIWALCHRVGCILCTILLIGVVLYR